ncbi:MAG: hypothetical protein LBB56_05005 [Chitinispirillales bacterium]|jgi:hypothetical protein|nr:hypothetical protein [Chitinispirillales bacterium]
MSENSTITCCHHTSQQATAQCSKCGKNICKKCNDAFRGVCYDCANSRLEGTMIDKKSIVKALNRMIIGSIIGGILGVGIAAAGLAAEVAMQFRASGTVGIVLGAIAIVLFFAGIGGSLVTVYKVFYNKIHFYFNDDKTALTLTVVALCLIYPAYPIVTIVRFFKRVKEMAAADTNIKDYECVLAELRVP